jgi:hypothetical protein
MHEGTVFVNIISFSTFEVCTDFILLSGVWEWIGGFDLMPFVSVLLWFLLFFALLGLI